MSNRPRFSPRHIDHRLRLSLVNFNNKLLALTTSKTKTAPGLCVNKALCLNNYGSRFAAVVGTSKGHKDRSDCHLEFGLGQAAVPPPRATPASKFASALT